MGDIDVWGRWNHAGVRALVRFHIHTDFDFMLAPTLDYAAHRTNVHFPSGILIELFVPDLYPQPYA